jgi:hypothetical protein
MRILTLISFLILQHIVFGQISFYKLYSGNGFDKGQGIVQLEDSSYVITGSSSSWEGSSQAFLLKIDSLGNYLWSQQLGGPESEEGKRVLYNKDLGFYVAGFTNSFGAGDFDAYLVKTNLNGEKLWEKNYGKSTHWERVNDAVMALDSGIVMVGESTDLNTGNTDVLIIKTNKNGDTLWTKNLGSVGEDRANTIVRINDNYLIGGQYFIPDSNMVKGFILEMNDSGGINRFDTISHLSGNYVVNDISLGINKFYVSGYRIVNPSNHDAYCGVYDISGQLINHYTTGDGGEIRNERFMQIAYNSIKNKVAIGYQNMNSGTFQDNFDLVFAYFDPTELFWLNQFKSLNNEGLDEVNDILCTSDGGYIAIGTNESTGESEFTNNGGSNIYIMKIDKNDVYPSVSGTPVFNQLVGIDFNSEMLKGKVFPNPFKDEFTIELEGDELTNAILLNNIGQQIETFEFQSATTYSTANLSQGTYFLKIGNSMIKLVKLD